MMKKILSIMLTVCMLLTMVVVPVAVRAAEADATYESTTLGSYYEFTFEDGNIYNYVPNYRYDVEGGLTANDGKWNYKGKDLYPLRGIGNESNTVTAGHKTLQIGDETLDVLEITNYQNVQFTPLTKEGKPYEFTPGKNYTVKVKMFLPRATAYSTAYLALGTNNNRTVYDGKISGTSYNVLYPYNVKNSVTEVNGIGYQNMNPVSGGTLAVNFKDGDYDKTTTLGSCLGHGDNSCSHASKNEVKDKIYREIEYPITVPAIFGEPDGNNAYSVEVQTDTGDTTTINNYLTFYLGGGNVNGFVNDANIAYYGSEDADKTSKIPTTYQFVSIEVCEQGTGAANIHVGDSVTTVTGAAGEEIDMPEVEIPEGYEFAGWYLDEAGTQAAPATPTFEDGKAIDLYAKFTVSYDKTTLGSYYKFTFDDDYNYNYVAEHSGEDGVQGVAEEYKGNTFYPMWANRTTTNPFTAQQKEITLKNGNKYNVLEINSSAQYGYFTPVTNDGQPYELTPGKTYNVSVKMFVPRAVAYSNARFVVGQNTQVAAEDGDKLNNGSNQLVITPYQSGELGYVSGASKAVNFKDGDYDETTILGTSNIGTYDNNKVFVEKTVTITAPEIYTKDANNSYSADLTTTKGNQVSLNNYLTLYLKGYNSVYNKYMYTEGTTPHYGTGEVDTVNKVPSTYQIVSIEVVEQGSGIVPFTAGEAYKIADDAQDGHTYKVEYSYKAQEMNGDVSVAFGTAAEENAFDYMSSDNAGAVEIKEYAGSEWKKATHYFTVDLSGDVIYENDNGLDYEINTPRDAMYVYFNQEADQGNNILCFKDFVVEDMGEVVGKGDASILIPAEEEAAEHQALRYYFNYKTTNGTQFKLGDKDFTVIERGFIYKNGKLSSGSKYAADLTLANVNNNSIVKTSIKENLDKCWKYENEVLTFSTYIKGFDKEDMRKLIVRAFLTIRDDETGAEYTIYSDTINRSVAGIKVQQGTNPEDLGRVLVWSEEFNSDAAAPSPTNSKFQNWRFSTAPPEGIVYSDNNCFIDNGDLVMRTTVDGDTVNIPKQVSTIYKMSFCYGYLEMEAKVPSVESIWPAFWLRTAPEFFDAEHYQAEIDIFEVYGTSRTPSTPGYGVAIPNILKWTPDGLPEGQSWQGCNSSNSSAVRYYLDNLDAKRCEFNPNDYNRFGLEWTPEYLAFSINGVVYCKIDITQNGDFCRCDTDENGSYDHAGNMDCFHRNANIILGQAIYQDPAVNEINSGVDFRINYIRLYQNEFTERLDIA